MLKSGGYFGQNGGGILAEMGGGILAEIGGLLEQKFRPIFEAHNLS